jgi:hypothetical protein
MKNQRLKIALFLSVVGFFVAGSNATIIVSGDLNIISALPSGSRLTNSGNQMFFENILDGSMDVAILDQLGTNTYATMVNSFYASTGSVKSTIISSVTASSLGCAGMLIAPLPANEFSGDELIALNCFVNNGGSVFLLGDIAYFSANNGIINKTLLDLGSSMNVVDATIDGGKHLAAGAQIADDGYTNGIQSITYGNVSNVHGGTPLFFSSKGSPFVAYEQHSVPEPSIVLLMMVSMAGLWGFRRRNR